MSLIMHTPADELRFWWKVGAETESGCWPWEASADDRGYGKMLWNGRLRPAHQVALIIAGVLPPGDRYEVDHVVCHNPPCVNPAHLEWVPVDGRENSVRHHRSRTHCIHGHEMTEANTYVHVKDGKVARSC